MKISSKARLVHMIGRRRGCVAAYQMLLSKWGFALETESYKVDGTRWRELPMDCGVFTGKASQTIDKLRK